MIFAALREGSVAVRSRFTLALASGFAVTALWAPTAGAGLLFTGEAETCETETSQPFRPWNDGANYVLVPGGSFEGEGPDWSLRNGASVLHGNESFYVHGARDRRSLYLPDDGTATTPTMCFDLGDWHLRFFIRKADGGSGSVRVTIIVKTLLGVASTLDGGTVGANGQWSPSPRVGLLLSNVTSVLGTRAVAFRFRANGTDFRVDDVYLDPWKSY
jgi:hypothetical protein